MDIVEGWIIGAAIDKTFAAAQKNLCQSQWQRAVAAEAFGRSGNGHPWWKQSDAPLRVGLRPGPTLMEFSRCH